MADDTYLPIEAIRPGFMVTAFDPVTGATIDRPVLDIPSTNIDKHMIRFDLDGDDQEQVTATAEHPLLVAGRGWVLARDLRIGDRAVGVDGKTSAIRRVVDLGMVRAPVVFNLNVGDTHTYTVRVDGADLVVHNASCPLMGKFNVKKAPGVYIIHLKNGKKYVGIATKNMHGRVDRHLTSRRGALKRDGYGLNDISRIHSFHLPRASQSQLVNLERRLIKRYGGPSRGRGRTLNRRW
jgi:predicted GIY-YIG superfamily endonuclease